MKTFKEYILEQEVAKENAGNTDINYPGGVYIAVTPDEITANAIIEYQKKYLKQYEINDELHSTIIYSQKPHVDVIEPESYQATATFESFELFGPNEDTLVIKLDSKELELRNKELVEEYGFISDFDEYKPHITLAYGIKNIDLNSLPTLDFSMTLQDEYVEPLDTNWANNSDDDSDDDDNDDDNSGSETFVGKEMSKTKKEDKKEKE